jgi:hypothetical protein
MWEDVGVIHSRMGLERDESELSAVLDEAGRLWEAAACGSGSGGHSGGGGREAAALRDAARAIVIGLQMGASCKQWGNGNVCFLVQYDMGN